MNATLSKTETKVMGMYLLNDDLTKRQLAEKLFRSPGTIQRHFQNVYAKLGIKNERQLMHWYCEHKLFLNLKNLLVS